MQKDSPPLPSREQNRSHSGTKAILGSSKPSKDKTIFK